jgi:hypothetical protein
MWLIFDIRNAAGGNPLRPRGGVTALVVLYLI